MRDEWHWFEFVAGVLFTMVVLAILKLAGIVP